MVLLFAKPDVTESILLESLKVVFTLLKSYDPVHSNLLVVYFIRHNLYDTLFEVG